MFNMISKKDDLTELNELIKVVQTQMAACDCDSEEFAVMNAQLEKLYKMKTTDKSSRVSADTLVIVAGNLAGIGLILNYERMHAVTSKALGFVLKSKI